MTDNFNPTESITTKEAAEPLAPFGQFQDDVWAERRIVNHPGGDRVFFLVVSQFVGNVQGCSLRRRTECRWLRARLVAMR
jgi:hypothetical protein